MRPRRVGIPLLVAASAAGVLAGASAAQADAVARQPFAADSGDTCGGTKGTFVWDRGKPAVDATGTLVDSPCGNDGRFASAIFVAYAGGQRVDDEIVRADNGAEEFRFSLVNTGSTAPVERVTVQVCRFAPVPEPPVRCGPKREFRSPFATESPAAPRVLGAGAPEPA